MKKLYKILLGILLIILIGTVTVSIIYSKQLNQKISEINQIKKNKNKFLKYHFTVVVNDSENNFWQQFKKGAYEAAKKYNIDIEFNGVSGISDIEKALKYLDIATVSKVDGIITQAVKKEDYNNYIDKAVENEIPVVTVESDAEASKRSCFVGTNSFEKGISAGNLMLEATGGHANIAIILQDFYGEQLDITSNLTLQGFKDIINKNDDMHIITIEKAKKGLLSAENIALKIINSYPNVDTIFCTSAKDTLGVAQVLVNFNKVGDIKIIGYDVTPEIFKYIEKGIIYGTLGRRPKDIGYKSIKALYDIKNGNMPSDFIDTGLDIITKKNLDEYKKNENYKTY